MKVRGTKSDTSFRTVPVIQQMKELLEEMRNLRPPKAPTKRSLQFKTIGKSLKTVCGQLMLPPLTHQDLRHSEHFEIDDFDCRSNKIYFLGFFFISILSCFSVA